MYSQTLDNMKLTASEYMYMYILIAEYSTSSRKGNIAKKHHISDQT